MTEQILILDFGAQFRQVIAGRWQGLNLRHFEQDLGMLGRNFEQHLGRTGGRAPPLLPILSVSALMPRMFANFD